MYKRWKKSAIVILMIAFIITPFSNMLVRAETEPFIEKDTLDILIGEEFSIPVKNQASDTYCEWASGNNEIITVNQNGVIKGIKEGRTVITCTVLSPIKTFTITKEVNVLTPDRFIQSNAGLLDRSDKENIYTFDNNISSITVNIGHKDYDINKDKVFQIVSSWKKNKKSYELNKDMILKRTAVLNTYDVYILNKKSFSIIVDLINQSLSIIGKAGLNISKAVRVFTFDDNITGFTAIVGSNAYNITIEKLQMIATDWPNDQFSYKVPGTNITLFRTGIPLTFQVKITGYSKFTMKLNIPARKVTLYGAPNIFIRNIIREFTFDSSVTGFTLRIGWQYYLVTMDKIIAIALAWDNNDYSYLIPGTNILLYRTFSKDIYGVEIGTDELFILTLDRVNNKVTLTGGIRTDFIEISNIIH